jgi:hypothetical protein
VYTGASRAIVSEALSSELPGEFAPEANYLPFTTPAQCVEQVQHLMNDPVLMRAQMRANWAYHNAWVRADALAMRVIGETLELADPSRARAEKQANGAYPNTWVRVEAEPTHAIDEAMERS